MWYCLGMNRNHTPRHKRFASGSAADAWASEKGVFLEPIGTCWEERKVAEQVINNKRIYLGYEDMEYSIVNDEGVHLGDCLEACPVVIVWNGLEVNAPYSRFHDFDLIDEARKEFDYQCREATAGIATQAHYTHPESNAFITWD